MIFGTAYMREQMKDPWDKRLNPEGVWDAYQRIALISTPNTEPIVDTVIYHYDYEHPWDVKVTCEEVYYEQENGFVDRKGNLVDEELQELFTDYIMKEKPVCLEKDGLSVLDNVSGINGYCEFLKYYFEEENEEKRMECRRWANRQGWSVKDVNLRRFL